VGTGQWAIGARCDIGGDVKWLSIQRTKVKAGRFVFFFEEVFLGDKVNYHRQLAKRFPLCLEGVGLKAFL
jgi:hypothetical protein